MLKCTSACLAISVKGKDIYSTETHQGSRTDQFKNTAARPSRVKSVTTALPL